MPRAAHFACLGNGVAGLVDSSARGFSLSVRRFVVGPEALSAVVCGCSPFASACERSLQIAAPQVSESGRPDQSCRARTHREGSWDLASWLGYVASIFHSTRAGCVNAIVCPGLLSDVLRFALLARHADALWPDLIRELLRSAREHPQQYIEGASEQPICNETVS